MVKRKIDNRIRVLIENGAACGHRTMFIVVGDKSREQVVYLHHMLSKSSLKQASVLWCYKKELTFSSNRRKRIKQVKAKMKMGRAEMDEDDPFEMFVSMTDIRYCYYKETHKILGNTYKMCVLQDFEALTPNLLCRTMETVEGGGVIILLLQSLDSLRQLYTLSMDVHSRYRTEAHERIIPRFNERFILSLASCRTCILMDDHLRILPLSSHLKDIEPVPPRDPQAPLSQQDQDLRELKQSLKDTPPIGLLVGLCKTADQAKVVLQFVLSITEKLLRTTVTLTASRGRGKSAAMGLSIAGAIAFGYSNIFVTSPSPENLNTLFEFVLKGLQVLGYEEHLHYQLVRSNDPQYNKCVMRIAITRDHRQVIQYIAPSQHEVLGQAELVVVDEAAAIPLPHIRSLLGPYLVFLSSTISGYEGTGRSLSLKLFDQLRKQTKQLHQSDQDPHTVRQLKELTLTESIRYKSGDPVEAWLHRLLCLEAELVDLPAVKDIVPPKECQLFYVNRDTLFGYHSVSEKFLSQVTGLLVSSHYKNTPDDLQTLSDAPAHHLFVLIPQRDESETEVLPSVLCVIQVALEGKISKSSVMSAMNHGEKPAGDLIPWTVSNLFQNHDFPQLSGARIVRIATHPELQGKGYGSRALSLLEDYYTEASSRADFVSTVTPEQTNLNVLHEEEIGLLEENLLPNIEPSQLLMSLNERPPEALHYLGVAFGATQSLLTFWKRSQFTPVYLSQVWNNLTGEHTTIMLKVLGEDKSKRAQSWLRDFWFDFRKRMIQLFGGSFKSYDCKFALSILTNGVYKAIPEAPNRAELSRHVNQGDLKRLQEYQHNQCDVTLIADIIPRIARLYFLSRIPNCRLKPVQAVILCGVGVQRKTVTTVAEELGIEKGLIMSQMRSLLVDLSEHLKTLWDVAKEEKDDDDDEEQNIASDISVAMKDNAEHLLSRQSEERQMVQTLIDVSQFEIASKETFCESPERMKKKKKLNLESIQAKKKKKDFI